MICEFCGKDYLAMRGIFTRHKMHCKLNPNRIPVKGHKLSEETKKKVSEGMRKAHTEGRAHNIGNCRWNNKPSYPESWFMKVIQNEDLDNEYVREMPYHGYSLDFAWPKKKVCVEIDGEQHYRKGEFFEKQRKRDERKDALLKEEGWLEFRASWQWICENPKEFISGVSQLLERTLPVNEIEKMKNFLLTKEEKLKIKEEKRKKAEKEGHIAKNGKINMSKLPDEIWEKRRDTILNSKVDLTNYGCITQLEKVTGLTRRQVCATIKRFGIVYNKRKSCLGNSEAE